MAISFNLYFVVLSSPRFTNVLIKVVVLLNFRDSDDAYKCRLLALLSLLCIA